jgi:hypothetical protein
MFNFEESNLFKMNIFYCLLIVLFLSAVSLSQNIQNEDLLKYADFIPDFDKTGATVSHGLMGMDEIDIKNSNGDVLRFKVASTGELLEYHCGIAFILYRFNKGENWINSVTTYSKEGRIKGDDEFSDAARTELIIDGTKMNLLHAKFETLDENDGNVQINDADQEIISMKRYDSVNRLVDERFISTDEYWKINRLLWRP